MCIGGGGSPSGAAPAPAAPVEIEEVRAPELGDDVDESRKRAQLGKQTLRVSPGAVAEDTVGAGISSGIKLT